MGCDAMEILLFISASANFLLFSHLIKHWKEWDNG